MKILIIGSSQYQNKFMQLKRELMIEGNEVRIPLFDTCKKDEFELCIYNRNLVEWADKIYLIWDGRSIGTIFDMGMVFMSRKPLIIYFIESKTLRGVFEKYAENSEK